MRPPVAPIAFAIKSLLAHAPFSLLHRNQIRARRHADALGAERDTMKHLCESLSETVLAHQVQVVLRACC